MAPKRTIFDPLDLDSIGLIHLLVLSQADKSKSTVFGMASEYCEVVPEIKRLSELVLRDLEKIMQAPSQKDFRKGRLPSEKKPLPREKQLAAFLLATKGKRESLRVVVRIWNFVLAVLPGALSKKQALSAMRDFVLPGRSKLLRKWRAEPRFKELMRAFEGGYTESLVNEMVSVVSHATFRPLLESARAIYIIGQVIAPMEGRAQRSFIEQFGERFRTIYKHDRQAAKALALAGMYALKPYGLKPLADKKWSDFLKKEVSDSFEVQRDALKVFVVESSKKKRMAAALSLDGLMIVRQIVLMDILGMIDHAAYGERVLRDFKEKLRRSGREKAKKRK